MANDDKTPPKGGPEQPPETGKTQPDSASDPEKSGATGTRTSDPAGQGKSDRSGKARRKGAAGSRAAKPEHRRRRLWIPVTLVLILLLALCAAGLYQGWQIWQEERAAWADEQQALSQNIRSLEQRLGSLDSAQNQQDQTVTELRSRLEESESRLVELATQLDRDMAVQSSDIQRLEIEYLLRNARHVSLLNQDIAQAEQLLLQADRQLAELDNLAYLPVREALATDIQMLRELPRPDIDGLYFELQALANRAPEWSWWPDTTAGSPNDGPDAGAGSDRTWLASVWSDLRQLVTVRYRSDTTSERLSPATFQQLQTQFQLFIQQAQVALIQRNEPLFQASLEQAAEWLERGMDQVPESRQLVNRLTRLADTRIELELPRIDRGLQALQQLDETDDTSAEETAE